jgi:pre-mRNA-splicing factor ATP-dependent RNA helicase DHX38/PRP16
LIFFSIIDGSLSALGKQMVNFPIEPIHSRVLLSSSQPDFACSEEIMTIVAMLGSSDDSIFITPPSSGNSAQMAARERALSAKRRFASFEGDLLTLLEVYRAYSAAKDQSGRRLYVPYILPVLYVYVCDDEFYAK